MFIYILCLIKSFVNGYLQKIYNIIRNFFTFSALRRIFDAQYQSKCKLSNKIEFRKKLFQFNIDFN